MADDAQQSASPPQSPAMRLLLDAEAQLATLGKTFDFAGLSLLRAMIAGHAELGGPVGRVMASLYQLIDQLLATGRFDREALAVHVRAWRLLLTSEPDGEAVDALFGGLKQLRDLYADPKAA
jgi:hypothetical protein